MRITQLRNATIVIESGPNRIVVDPMLAPKGALPPLKFLEGRIRNPLVDLPDNADTLLRSATHCLITHCQKGHFDHLDRAGKRWLRERQLPVICTARDAAHLRQRGLNVMPLASAPGPQPFLGGQITTVPCTHGKGVIGMLMEHGVGYFIELPGEPGVYLSGDTILTPQVREFIARHQPQVSIIPAGGARFDLGGDIIMGLGEAIELTKSTKGAVIANHLEALSHCPVQRAELKLAAEQAGLGARLKIPADGEMIEFPAAA
jgi:L-ascorbate metabolism protein UlaG (beta-lactamase superfamily)